MRELSSAAPRDSSLRESSTASAGGEGSLEAQSADWGGHSRRSSGGQRLSSRHGVDFSAMGIDSLSKELAALGAVANGGSGIIKLGEITPEEIVLPNGHPTF